MKVWVLKGFSWEAGVWETIDIFSSKEKAQECIAEDYGDNYKYDPTDDEYNCGRESFYFEKLMIQEMTVR